MNPTMGRSRFAFARTLILTTIVESGLSDAILRTLCIQYGDADDFRVTVAETVIDVGNSLDNFSGRGQVSLRF